MTMRLIALFALMTAESYSAEGLLRFEKRQLTDRYYCDGVTAADIDRDRNVDIVAGPFWYSGPVFTQAHEFYPAEALPPEKSPSNSMYSFAYDFSGDGWNDILVLGRVHLHPAAWYENPGPSVALAAVSDWARHDAFERVRGESPILVDLDGDGRPQLICHWDNTWGWVEPDWKQPRKSWSFHALGSSNDHGHEEWPQFYHGQGAADVNDDGRLDLLLNDGWYEQPAAGRTSPWAFHRGLFSSDRGGAQMFADDLDGDGDSDVISALNAHGWGLAWFEKLADEEQAADEASVISIGTSRYERHVLMGDRSEEMRYGVSFSQPHALAYQDLDGDGLGDIVVGKRLWAHGPTGDVEPNAPAVLYWFQQLREAGGGTRFVPHQIDAASGVGVQLTVVDVNGDSRPDVLTASKLGVFVFLNRGDD